GGSWPHSICVTRGRRALVLALLGGSCDRFLDGGEGLLAQFAQDVVGATADRARDREQHALAATRVVACVYRARSGLLVRWACWAASTSALHGWGRRVKGGGRAGQIGRASCRERG